MNENGSGDGECASKSVPTSIPATVPTPTLMLKGGKRYAKRTVGREEDVGEVGEKIIGCVPTAEETRSSFLRTHEVA
jgi:hypothetical protein